MYVMLGENPAETLFCGELRPTGKEGQGELKWDFSPDALGHGKKAEDFLPFACLTAATVTNICVCGGKKNGKQKSHKAYGLRASLYPVFIK